MGKRLTDTDIWDEDWFVELPSKYKLFWNYLKDKCDNAGFWRPNKILAQRIIGEPINTQEFLDFVNIDKKRIIILPSGKWFIRDFFIFQYGDVFHPDSLVHKGVLKTLVQNGVHPSEILNGSIGNLKSVDLQTLKQIAYQKGTKSLREAYGKDTERDKE